MAAVIEIEGLRKEYRRVRRPPSVAVDGLDLVVPEGGVFGFLGPNGSGKTTTIRCLLGLANASAGRISVLGAAVPSGLAQVMPSIGAVVESASFLGSMTGREHIRLLAAVDGIPARAADASLDAVGLGSRATDSVKAYSLGMRQRLALAVALVKDPALLVLDEPANGLDPAGMREIRELLRRLGAEGRTVFVSSHLLSEVEQTCDRVAILNRGRCVVSASVAEVLASSTGTAWRVIVERSDVAQAEDILRRATFDVVRDGDALVVRGDGGDRIGRILGELGVWVIEVRRDHAHLEEMFLAMTAEAA